MLNRDEERGTGRTTRALEQLIARAANDGANTAYVTRNALDAIEKAIAVCERSARRFEMIHATRTLVVYGERGGTIRFVLADEGHAAASDWRGRGRELVFDHAVAA